MAFQFLRRPVASLGLLLLLTSSPSKIVVESGGFVVAWATSAHAKENGDKGKGNDKSGGGNGKSGKDNGQGGKSQNSGSNLNQQPKATKGANPKTGDVIERRGRNISVRHSNGIFESIVGAIYEMRDAKGRRIIRRAATNADRARLAAMSG